MTSSSRDGRAPPSLDPAPDAGSLSRAAEASTTVRRVAEGWREYWNRDQPIYVNARHRALHGERVAEDLVALIPSPQARLLDHGCGDALAAGTVAGHCGHLYLFDTSDLARARTAQRYRGDPRIAILDEDGLAALPDNSLDLVFCCSVLQYVAPEPTGRLFQLWHAKLKPGGRLVVADVIAPDTGMMADAAALLRFAVSGGFLLAALRGLVATLFSNYRKLRSDAGFFTYRESEMADLLRAHGFAGGRAPRNVGHNPARMSFIATRTG